MSKQNIRLEIIDEWFELNSEGGYDKFVCLFDNITQRQTILRLSLIGSQPEPGYHTIYVPVKKNENKEWIIDE